ncbi:hypothetical protein AM433_006820 [Pseudomonas aeruginosa]|uniref:hypothetical protein n=1 Tax=Pseudomonas aeruginosa TaxID=287 RepID=UPI00210A27D2|nr:hypothetical protein [Pseudomonas aeruginosa]OKN68438.1 hypothetical protein AM433_006820 [Pseudomonas aeruginosa]
MAWANERAEGVIEEAIVAMRRSVIPRHDQLVWRGQIEMAYTSTPSAPGNTTTCAAGSTPQRMRDSRN